ncbi:MAG: hypothetical protein H8E55_52485 [Pelagibacterales bacterium]|nr:hypothetical protein [Pelagibacterales bacterium]
MVKKNYSKSKIVITDKDRKKFGVCEHDQVSYKALDKMCSSLLLHCKRLSRDIDRKGRWMEQWMKKQKERMTLEDQLTEDKAHLLLKENTIETLQDEIKEKNLKIEELQSLYDEAIEINKDIVVKNRDCIKFNTEILKDHNDILRAYNGLAEMGRFAEESGVDIKKHSRHLPEHNKYDFSQRHTLLESGKVKHSYKLKKKNGKDH